jgi:hypothetical protein
MKEILKTLVETMTLPEDSYLEQDAEILEIFIEELDEIFVELEPLLFNGKNSRINRMCLQIFAVISIP